ncbi:hypothetical protein A9Q99_04245 [Gammaproteobacteria bacterium 45_16_T64]|nr:hypothetical protein A9Q99_04245 [Gammaproteobacteria bacterium 45_16_T64]
MLYVTTKNLKRVFKTAAMAKQPRDLSVDMIKGFGCLMMIIAHLPAFQLTVSYGLATQLAGPGTVFFFGTAGITAAMQAQRYPIQSLLPYFGVLFFLGSSWNILVHGNLTSFKYVEIFQIITLGSALICWLERKGPSSQTTLLLLTSVLGGLKFIMDIVAPEFDGLGWLFVSNDYIPHYEEASGGKRSFPGFPIFPWLSIFPLGLFCYRASKQTNAIGMAAMLTIYCVTSYFFGANPTEKWDTSIPYLAHCYLYLFLAFWLFDGGRTETNKIGNAFAFTGKNSLIFFFFHPFALVLGVIVLSLSNVYVAWAFSAIMAYIITRGAAKLKPSPLFASGWSWLILGIILFSMPIMDEIIDTALTHGISRLVAAIIGAIIAVNTPLLAELTKKSVGRS